MLFHLRNWLHYEWFAYSTRAIWSSPPLPCAGNGTCEIHTMVSRKDLALYMVAVKSLLRFVDGIGVVVHDDGSLGPDVRLLLAKHLVGCRIIDPGEAESRARAELGEKSFLYRLRNVYISFRRLIDAELWSGTPKKLMMDSDVLVLRPPKEVVDWIEHGDRPFLIGQPPPDLHNPDVVEKKGTLGPGSPVQAIFTDKVEQISQDLGWPPRFLSGGTGGFYGTTTALNLQRIQSLGQACEARGVPLGRWGAEQCFVVYLLSSVGARRLNTDLYVNFYPQVTETLNQAHVVHFFGVHRFQKGAYVQWARKTAKQLKAQQRKNQDSLQATGEILEKSRQKNG
jgi:hypothetical protein